MEQKSMTALVSAFSRAYHSEQKGQKVFDDYLAKNILTNVEYEQIASNMAKGINFFNPSFEGTQEEALRWIVDNQLSPSPIGRAAFAEAALKNAVKIGAKQYLIFAAGYDTFACRQPDWASKIEIFELDHPATSADKQSRVQLLNSEKPENLHFISVDFTKDELEDKLIKESKFSTSRISFCSLLGLSYYLDKETFIGLLRSISNIVPQGSSVVFDYPDEYYYSQNAGDRAKKQAAMAAQANEKMLASYSYVELEKILSDNGFLIYEHLTPKEITEQYFQKYNKANPEHTINAFDNVNYCLAVRE